MNVGELVYKIIAQVDGSFSTNIKKTETDVQRVEKQMESADKKTSSWASTLKGFATAAGLTYLVSKIVQFGTASVTAFTAAQQSMVQFNNAQQNVAGTTKEQIEDLNEYILQLERKTTIDDKQIRQGAQILAQDQISIENQKKLLAGIVDLSIANANNSGDIVNVEGTAKAIGLAFAEGNLGRLVKQNIAGITEAQKKLFETGDDAQRTAILMKVLAENAAGAGDALAGSFKGQVNKAKDAVEDLQVAIGSGLVIGMQVLAGNVLETTGELGTTEDTVRSVGVSMTYLASMISYLINFFKLLGQTLILGGKTIYGLGQLMLGLGSDIGKAFSNATVGRAISFWTAMKQAVDGDFKGAIATAKAQFKNELAPAMSETKKAWDEMSKSLGETSDAQLKTMESMGKNAEQMANAETVYAQHKAAQDKLTEAKTNYNKAQKRVIEQSAEEKEAVKQSADEIEKFKTKLLDTIEASKKTAIELRDNLKKAFKELGDDITKSFDDSGTKLAELYIDAQKKKEELEKERSKGFTDSDLATKNAEELALVEKTLSARVGYEERAAAKLIEIKKRITDAGLDVGQLDLTAIDKQKTFNEKIAEAQANAKLSEFQLFEQEETKKLDMLVTNFITESTIINNKIIAQKAMETDLTAFLTSEQVTRKKAVEAFANASIQKYGEMAASLRTVISLQSQIAGLSASSSKPQFHNGGMVGSMGGEVHPGEFVVPANMVASMPSLISSLEGLRGGNSNTVNAPININAVMGDGADVHALSSEIAWLIGKR